MPNPEKEIEPVTSTDERVGAVNPTFSPDHDPWTTMLVRFGAVAGRLGRKLFGHIQLAPEDVERIRECGRQGSIVYVMRYPSILDTLLMNILLLEADLPLAHLSNGKTTIYLRRAITFIRVLFRRIFSILRMVGKEQRQQELGERCARLVASRKPVLLFLRGAKLGVYLRRVDAVEAKEAEKDLLADLASMQRNCDQPIFLVPLAVFWQKGPRQQARLPLSSIFYGVKERPGDFKKLLSFLLNYKDLFVRVGRPIDLKTFIAEHEPEGQTMLVKKIRRSLQLFLYREEKVVHGPVIKPRRQIRDIVVSDPEVVALIERLSDATGEDEAKIREQAESYFNEIAANFHGTYIAFLNVVANWIYSRIFSGIEVNGLEKVADCARRNPLVLIPCHRSHFDYLIVSSLFYNSHLSPPHIAAGINLSFWPLGPLFRGAGAYFLRRSFGGNELYKTVFGKYIMYLIKEGYTQEFFIEGGRSRTGKMLNPKLGMLSMLLDAYVQGVRRDLYFVPISITYDRLVEEKSYAEEIEGGAKEKESLRAVVSARTVLKRKYGKVYVSFGEPISIREAMGSRLEPLRSSFGTEKGDAERKTFTEEFGYRILRNINAATVSTASALVATALLAKEKNAVRSDELLEMIHDLHTLLRLRKVAFGAQREDGELNYRDSIRFLVSSGLVDELTDGRETVYTFDDRRRQLDFYKNNIIHYFVVPSILAQGLLRPTTRPQLWDDLFRWIGLFRYEFFLPDAKAVSTRAEVILSHYIAEKLVDESEGGLRPTPEGTARLALYAGVLGNFREAYYAVVDAVFHARDWPLPEKKLFAMLDVTFRKYLLLDEIGRPEAASRFTYDNALRCLVSGEILVCRQERMGRGRKVDIYDRGERFGELADLRQALVASLKAHDS